MMKLMNILKLISLKTQTLLLLGGLENSKIVSGTKDLLNDASKILLILAPIIGGLSIGYAAIRKMNAEEHDIVKWQKRIFTIIICTVLVFLASIIINVVTGYYT